MTPAHTAGTAGRDYRTEPAPHRYTAACVEPGERAHCTCGSGRDEPGARHIPTQRGRRASEDIQ